MSGQVDRMASQLEHNVIEAAKRAHTEDSTLTFVQHLENEARARCGEPGKPWRYEISFVRSGWRISVEHDEDRPTPEPDFL